MHSLFILYKSLVVLVFTNILSADVGVHIVHYIYFNLCIFHWGLSICSHVFLKMYVKNWINEEVSFKEISFQNVFVYKGNIKLVSALNLCVYFHELIVLINLYYTTYTCNNR